MSLIPVLANGYCAKPSAQQLRNRVLHATALNLICCGVKTRVTDGKDSGLCVQIMKCMDCPSKLRSELGDDATLSDVRTYLADRALKQIAIIHSRDIAAHTEIVFHEDALSLLCNEFIDSVRFPEKVILPANRGSYHHLHELSA